MVSATIKAPRKFPKKEKQYDRNQQYAFGQIVQHRARREMNQVATVQKRDYLHARWQDALVQLFDFGVDQRQRLV